MDTTTIRRKNLQLWIDEKFGGVQAEFINFTGINQGELSGLLKKKSFGEKKARSLEKLAGMPNLWLDIQTEKTPNAEELVIPVATIEGCNDDIDLSSYVEVELYDVKLSAGNGVLATWEARKDEPLLFRKGWFKRKGLSCDDVKAMYVRGDSMEPTLENWDTILVDISDTELVTGDIYAFVYNGKLFIKEACVKPESIELVSRNIKYKPISIEDADTNKLQVLGRMVWRGG